MLKRKYKKDCRIALVLALLGAVSVRGEEFPTKTLGEIRDDVSQEAQRARKIASDYKEKPFGPILVALEARRQSYITLKNQLSKDQLAFGDVFLRETDKAIQLASLECYGYFIASKFDELQNQFFDVYMMTERWREPRGKDDALEKIFPTEEPEKRRARLNKQTYSFLQESEALLTTIENLILTKQLAGKLYVTPVTRIGYNPHQDHSLTELQPKANAEPTLGVLWRVKNGVERAEYDVDKLGNLVLFIDRSEHQKVQGRIEAIKKRLANAIKALSIPKPVRDIEHLKDVL